VFCPKEEKALASYGIVTTTHEPPGEDGAATRRLARIIHENAGRNGSPLLRSEAVTTFGPVAKERADGRVYYTTGVELPSIFPDHCHL
jgi:hypothetical protein